MQRADVSWPPLKFDFGQYLSSVSPVVARKRCEIGVTGHSKENVWKELAEM